MSTDSTTERALHLELDDAIAAPINTVPEASTRAPLELDPQTAQELRESHGIRNRVGLGVQVADQGFQDPVAARRAFGLDFTVSLQEIQVSGKRAGNYLAIRHERNGDILGVVAGEPERDKDGRETGRIRPVKYSLIQPSALDLVSPASRGALISRGGSWRGDREIWMQSELSEFEGPVGPARMSAFARLGLDGKHAYTLGFPVTMTVCRNTYLKASRESRANGVRVIHGETSEERLQELRAAIDAAQGSIEQVKAQFEAMALRRVNEAETNRVRDAVYAPVASDATPKAKTTYANFLSSWDHAVHRAPGAMPGTAFGLAQAVTFYGQHSEQAMRRIRNGKDAMEDLVTNDVTERALQTVSVIMAG